MTVNVQSTADLTSLNGENALVLPFNKTEPTLSTRMLPLVVLTVLIQETTPSSTNLVSQSALFLVLVLLLQDHVTVLPEEEFKDIPSPKPLVMEELPVLLLMDSNNPSPVPLLKTQPAQPLVKDNGLLGLSVTVILEIKPEPSELPRTPLMEELLVLEPTTPLLTKFVLQTPPLVLLSHQNASLQLNVMMETNVLLTDVFSNHLEFPGATGLKPLFVTTAVSVLSILVILSRDVSSPPTSSVTITLFVPTNLATQSKDVNTPRRFALIKIFASWDLATQFKDVELLADHVTRLTTVPSANVMSIIPRMDVLDHVTKISSVHSTLV